jgi:PilZ domain
MDVVDMAWRWIDAFPFRSLLLYSLSPPMRKIGVSLLVAAYVLALYTSLTALTSGPAHAQLGATMLAAYAAPWPVVLACAFALNGLVLAVIPIRYGENWAIWLSLVTLLTLLATRTAADVRCLLARGPLERGCGTFMVAMVLGLVGLALAASRQSKGRPSGKDMQSNGYRREKRHPGGFRLQISSTARALALEPALTENVSSHGMRVRTGHSWKPGTEALVKSPVRELWVRARIVYCESLPRHSFALGLEFQVRGDTRVGR